MVRMKCIDSVTFSMVFLKNSGAYIESIDISPECMSTTPFYLTANPFLLYRWIETNIIDEHHT
jgi:hypothetical protein